MANHTSAKKAIRQTKKRTLINKSRVSRIRTYIKKVMQAVEEGSKELAEKALITAQAEIMKGVTKKVFKLNTASRKISRLTQRVKGL